MRCEWGVFLLGNRARLRKWFLDSMNTARFLTLFTIGMGLWTGCSQEASRQAPETTKTAPAPAPVASGNPLTAPVDYLATVAKAQKSANKTLSLVGIKQALQQYFVNEGHYPASLKDVVSPDLLPFLPDPPTGQKYDYNPKTGDLKLAPQ